MRQGYLVLWYLLCVYMKDSNKYVTTRELINFIAGSREVIYADKNNIAVAISTLKQILPRWCQIVNKRNSGYKIEIKDIENPYSQLYTFLEKEQNVFLPIYLINETTYDELKKHKATLLKVGI